MTYYLHVRNTEHYISAPAPQFINEKLIRSNIQIYIFFIVIDYLFYFSAHVSDIIFG